MLFVLAKCLAKYERIKSGKQSLNIKTIIYFFPVAVVVVVGAAGVLVVVILSLSEKKYII